MAKIMEAHELKEFLRKNHISQEKFAEKVSYSIGAVKGILSGDTNLNSEKQVSFSEAAIRLAELQDKRIDHLTLFDLKMNRDFANIAHDDVITWIETERFDRVLNYWNNFKSTYRWIDRESTQFLIYCKDLVPAGNDVDLRAELLRYMRRFSCCVANVQEALSIIQFFLNRESSARKNMGDYKRKHKISQKEFREKLIRDFSDKFYNDDSLGESSLVYGHIRCVNEMDNMAWDLLIAYTLVRADDESGKKVKKINEKLRSLINQVSQ